MYQIKLSAEAGNRTADSPESPHLEK